MADYDGLLRMQGTAHRYIEGLRARFGGMSVSQLIDQSRQNRDMGGLVQDFLSLCCDKEFKSTYYALSQSTPQKTASSPRQPSCTQLITEAGVDKYLEAIIEGSTPKKNPEVVPFSGIQGLTAPFRNKDGSIRRSP